MSAGLAVFLGLVVIYGAVSVWLGRFSITMPIIFVVTGVLFGPQGLVSAKDAELLVEMTLALLLFADASTLNFRQVRDDARLPGRLLLIAMPLVIALGGLVAYGLFPGEGLGFALLLATILAPTDAALGLPIFNNSKVPVRIRRALNVESGLNDGIATPFVTLFTAMALSLCYFRPNGKSMAATWWVQRPCTSSSNSGWPCFQTVEVRQRRVVTNKGPIPGMVVCQPSCSEYNPI